MAMQSSVEDVSDRFFGNGNRSRQATQAMPGFARVTEQAP